MQFSMLITTISNDKYPLRLAHIIFSHSSNHNRVFLRSRHAPRQRNRRNMSFNEYERIPNVLQLIKA